jgi:hypothetical protein
MTDNDPSQDLESQYWQAYEKDLAPLAAEIKEHADYMIYDLNPIGRFKNEYAGFAESALQDVAALEVLLEQMKKLLLTYKK